MYGKILAPEEIESRLKLLRGNSAKLVFTNGCFDLMHVGHIEYLMAARSLGSKLIVGVNEDTSVSILKGPTRPINNLENRMKMLAALQCVDVVIPFSEETPLNLIKQVRPHILVKGGDYTLENIVGASYVVEQGGEVQIIPFKKGFSTTQLIKDIKNL